MAEGARLESVYARKGIAGSNPALSASQAAAIAAFFVLSRCHSLRMSSGRETKKSERSERAWDEASPLRDHRLGNPALSASQAAAIAAFFLF